VKQRETTGKCSHGGKRDTSTNIPAKGGINKETTSMEHSPLAHLHKKAYQAAIDSTTDFLIGEGLCFRT